MSKNYKQLSLEQRYQIECLIKAGFSQKKIAEQLNVHASTISRELKRNITKRGKTAGEYMALNAQRKTNIRHLEKPKYEVFTSEMKLTISSYIKNERWSPELISNSINDMVSHERIYQWIWECKHTNTKETKPYKKLYQYLKHGKRRRKRGNRKDSRGVILDRTPIAKRPAIVAQRKRIGDIEVDLMMGRNHKGALLVMTDRATLHTRLKKLTAKDSNQVYQAIISNLMRNKYKPKTLTFDNDKAFSCHTKVANRMDVKTFFTRPYTSQDKGTVENRIGVIRRFFPKKTDLTFVSNKQVLEVERKINNRPIRKFNYLTANQVLLKKLHL